MVALGEGVGLRVAAALDGATLDEVLAAIQAGADPLYSQNDRYRRGR